MRLAAGVLFVSMAPVWGQIQAPLQKTASLTKPAETAKAVRLSPTVIGELEKTFDGRLVAIADPNEPLEILGDTRGLQLDGYGLVFTTEVSLVRGMRITPFLKEIPKSEQDRVYRRRLERLPMLKESMKEMLRTMAKAGAQLPATQQLVVAVRLWYGAWEETTSMPRQIVMHASRADAAKGVVETEER